MKKKFLIAFILVTMNLFIVRISNISAEEVYSGYLDYWVSDGVAEITDCRFNKRAEFIIPDTLGGYPVTEIADNAFDYCNNITSITIPNSVKSIGSRAFAGCEKLTSINIPEGIKRIEYDTFSCCYRLKNIKLPKSLTRICEGAFAYCSDLNIEIPEGVSSIDKHAFTNCKSLTIIKIPAKTTTLGEGAFSACKSLEKVKISEGVSSLGQNAFRGCTSLTNIEIPESIKSIGSSAFYECQNLSTVYYRGNSSKWNEINIGDYNENLTKANIHYNHVSSINLSYNANGGNEKIETVEIEENSSTTISSSIPTKDGYTFLGWSISSSAKTPEYNTNDIITVGTEDITLYAVWKKIICTKTQSLNGIFLVTPTGVENGNRVIFVCYNGDRMVYVNPYVYAGESTIPFTTSETYDKVKVMVWENLETCVPLCEAENVPLN